MLWFLGYNNLIFLLTVFNINRFTTKVCTFNNQSISNFLVPEFGALQIETVKQCTDISISLMP